MPLYESTELTQEAMKQKAKKFKCQCGGNLLLAWSADKNCYMLRCGNNLEHSEFINPHRISNYELTGYNMPGVVRRREKQMIQKYGEERTKAMVRSAGGNIIATLTQKGASEMLSILYPDATKNLSGKAAIVKGALMCRDYGLNPAMDHLFIIGYKNNKTNDIDYSVVTGIKAKRLICGRDRSYGYIDDTPRIMTPEEQERIFGEVDKSSIVTVCKLKDKDGNEFPGYGKWPKDSDPKGMNKGNSKFNMSCIRAESQALNKLNPGAMPADVDVVDERYIEKPIVDIKIEKPLMIEESDGQPVEAKQQASDLNVDGTNGHITESQTEELKLLKEKGHNLKELITKLGFTGIEKIADLTEIQAGKLIEECEKVHVK